MTTIFEERHFSWPDQPGNAKREAKLPWFWFTDVGEARTFLQLWWVWQACLWLLFINFWFVKNHVVGLALLVCTPVAQVMFMRVWVPLCQRAQPPLGKWQWFTGNWFNPRARHCLLLAWDVVREHYFKGAPKS
jgi:hypothetical protein